MAKQAAEFACDNEIQEAQVTTLACLLDLRKHERASKAEAELEELRKENIVQAALSRGEVPKLKWELELTQCMLFKKLDLKWLVRDLFVHSFLQVIGQVNSLDDISPLSDETSYRNLLVDLPQGGLTTITTRYPTDAILGDESGMRPLVPVPTGGMTDQSIDGLRLRRIRAQHFLGTRNAEEGRVSSIMQASPTKQWTWTESILHLFL